MEEIKWKRLSKRNLTIKVYLWLLIADRERFQDRNTRVA
jgi:hypothetical protein